jgi:hypothetical protein
MQYIENEMTKLKGLNSELLVKYLALRYFKVVEKNVLVIQVKILFYKMLKYLTLFSTSQLDLLF